MKGQTAEVGATRVAPNGYHYTRCPDGWVLTHRLVKEKQIGRQLASNERLRFIDGDRENFNDPDNIQVYVVREGTKQKRITQLQLKIEELQAELTRLQRE